MTIGKVTRTINPLHFEDLEPHRFEDLVRQLIYDFRDWRKLEATGRKGSDDDFDVRGWEVFTLNDDDESVDEEEREPTELDRIWLIQCKREKSITPKKLIGYLDDIQAETVNPLYGMIFVAACDFSKKTRDIFRNWCIEHKINKHYLWGRAELEDMLFYPKYDHLLFAYFGISIQIRKRSAKTRLRSLLSTKRQFIKHFGGLYGRNIRVHRVLVRDPDANEYPYETEIENFDKHPKWRVYDFDGLYHSGVRLITRSYYAYIDSRSNKWDIEDRYRIERSFNPWSIKQDRSLEQRIRHFWNQLPDQNRGTLEVFGHIPFDEILAIDENGDEYFEIPHLYAHFDGKYRPFVDGFYQRIVTHDHDRHEYEIEMKDRINYFPKEYPNIPEDKTKSGLIDPVDCKSDG
jgi:hypothetical protein